MHRKTTFYFATRSIRVQGPFALAIALAAFLLWIGLALAVLLLMGAIGVVVLTVMSVLACGATVLGLQRRQKVSSTARLTSSAKEKIGRSLSK
jgi:membrane protein implicated in regulation of membrane protease activity